MALKLKDPEKGLFLFLHLKKMPISADKNYTSISTVGTKEVE
ncbi:hypothetical protein Amet_0773 [Alkaliphilus metalliredigens QYMF]|uniref:Uncharacterized protein n=1 Tax=Alkaliphilus metalliredigens (strain QYMF) TaxID=293826 RepID=A6TLD0_ALKMQ|nr:hypothetical protein Amet_0773 [Alkaliphilus metalliredigens QYMF]